MNDNQFNTAITYLQREFSPNFIDKLKFSNIDNIYQHFGIGMMVRNVLRRSDVKFDDVWLDDNCDEMLKEGIRR